MCELLFQFQHQYVIGSCVVNHSSLSIICLHIFPLTPSIVSSVQMSAAALCVPALAPHFKEQELANIVWAYAKLRVSNDAVFQPLLAQARGKLSNFMPQVCIEKIWASTSTSCSHGWGL